MVSYLSRFLPYLTNAMQPLWQLIQKVVKWQWGEAYEGLGVENDLTVFFQSNDELDTEESRT